EDLHRVGEAVVDLAEPLLVADDDVLQRELHGVARAAPELLEVLRRAEALRPVLDDERRDALLLRRLHVRSREHHAEAADAPLRDEHLRAVQDPLVAVAPRRRPQPGGVAAAARLRERPRAQPLAPRGLRQVLLLLRLVPEGAHVPGAEPVVRRPRERERAVRPRDLLDADGVALGVHPRAAVLLRDADAEQPEVRELRDDLLREALLLVPLPGVRKDLRAGELADGLAKELVVLGQ